MRMVRPRIKMNGKLGLNMNLELEGNPVLGANFGNCHQKKVTLDVPFVNFPRVRMHLRVRGEKSDSGSLENSDF